MDAVVMVYGAARMVLYLEARDKAMREDLKQGLKQVRGKGKLGRGCGECP